MKKISITKQNYFLRKPSQKAKFLEILCEYGLAFLESNFKNF